MAVTYFYLDKDKKVFGKRIKTACFSSVKYEPESKKAVYFRYLVHPQVTVNQALDYVKFLNSIKWLPQINIKEFTESYTYTFKIQDKNSFKTFALLTVIRYLEEYPKMVNFILENKNNSKISKIKLLMAASFQVNAGGHGLIGYPKKVEEFISYKLPKEKFKPDNEIISTGLFKFFGNWTNWNSSAKTRVGILKHYNLTLVQYENNE